MNKIQNILNNYTSENPAIRSKIFQLIHHGVLANTGHLLIYPIDQGFEHGPLRSFEINTAAYDPHYHFDLAISSGFSAFAAPVGFLECVSNSEYFGQIPLILKINSANSLWKDKNPSQVVYSSVKQALQLGCIGIGLTIYPGSSNFNSMVETLKDVIQESKKHGLLVIIWSYPRGENLTSKYETALDVISYASHIAALLGAHIIKIKPPSDYIFDQKNIAINSTPKLQDRIKKVMQSTFNGRRMTIFSGGGNKNENDLLDEISAIKNGGGTGSIVGRNVFQRNENDARSLIQKIVKIYKN